MGTLKQDTFIRGLHVFKKKLAPEDPIDCFFGLVLDERKSEQIQCSRV